MIDLPIVVRRRVRRACRLCLWALVIAWGAAARMSAAEEPVTEVITSFEEFWRHGGRETERPIRVEMLVFYYDPAWGNLWGQIGEEVGFLRSGPGLPFRSRDRVLITGTVVPLLGLQPHTNTTYRILERDVPIEPLDANGRLREPGPIRARVVTLDAILDEQREVEGGHLEMRLIADNQVVRLFYWSETRPAQLFDLPEGSIVRVQGLLNDLHDPRANSQQTDLWVASREHVQKIGDLLSDPRFEAPITPIGQLSQVFLQQTRPARIAGVVWAYTPGREVTLRDDTGQMIVPTKQTISFQIGDVVEAWGMPFTGGADWLLRDAIVRRAAREVAVSVKAAVLQPATELRLVDQVLSLTPEEAALGRSVDLTGVVTWADLGQPQAIVSDSSGGILVHMPPDLDSNLYKAGGGVRVTGVTIAGAFASEVKARAVFSWGSALVPEATPATLEQLLTGREEGERVELRGYVTKVAHDETWTRLTLSASAGVFTARVARNPELNRLQGSIVFLRGVCRALANVRRQLTGIEIWVGMQDEIRVEQAAPADPFAVPLRRIGSLRQFSTVGAQSYWARIRGTVTHQLRGRLVYVQDGAESLLVLSEQTDPLAPGDVIEATGLPGFESKRLVLRESVYRKIDVAEEPAPVGLIAARLVDEDLEGRLVRLHGRIVSAAHEGDDWILSVESDDTVFSASLYEPRERVETAGWEPGSEINLTGVYEVIRDERRHPRAFRVQLRTTNDVTVVRRPSWWTPQRAFLVTGLLGVFIAIGLTWVASLRRRVQKQTHQIRQQVLKEANLEARHREIIAHASDFIFTTDVAGNFTSFNPAGERITGFTAEQARGMTIRDLIAPEDEAAGLALVSLAQTPDHEAVARFETRFQTRDGRRVWVETNARLITENGQPSGILGVVRDITERKLIEEELKRARDAAEANTQAKSAFLANMSHEIRTPMNGVIGMSNLLLDTPLRPDQREFAETIRASAEALLTVLNDILDFSKIEAGKLQFETVDFDLVTTVEDSLGVLAPRAVAKRIELVACIPPELPRALRGDPGRLRQVLINLIGNAVKFTEQGEVVVTVNREEETAQSVRLRFEVTDTGIGMSAEAQQQLFRAFVQADNSTTRRFGGTGLGLAISKQLVELMGGTIGLRSTPGEGSVFWFTVPATKQTLEKESATDAISPDLAGRRVLVVDDHATTRGIVERYLRAWQIESIAIPDRASAVEATSAAIAAGSPFDAYLIEHDKPGTDGIALARQLRQLPGAGRCAIFLLTSIDNRLSHEELAAAGLEGTLTKPIRRTELREKLERALAPTGAAPARCSTRQSQPDSNATGDGERTSLSSLRVLVAEDNPVNQRLIQLQLKKLGVAPRICGNGREAIAALAERPFDVVLMDCQMPELDGYEASRIIRGDARHEGVRIIAMTAHAMQGDRERCLAAGMDDYLSKPTRIEDLRAALERALFLRGQVSAAGSVRG